MDKNTVEKLDSSEAFLRVFLPNQNRILSFILCYIPNRTDAEDVFQNTTFVLWKKFDRYQPGSDFLAWSIMIARFEILSYYKKKKSEGGLYFDEEMQKILDAEMKAFDSRFEQRMDALRECLKKLISEEVRLLKMRYEENLPLARIAERLSITSAAVFKRISKIHSRLIQCIRQRIAFGEAV
ncbi:MAG TPA: sigma-70 family RNA polymerase sigma factor [Anaerohalosphaeraceae bacterium]|nr:sigma-70 family RNA polymerase sigma factor [Anaerohalosphaeraceae bacterium]